MKKWMLYMVLITGGFNAYGQLDLDSLQRLAAQNNPELKVLFYQYKAQLKQADINAALPDPQVMFGYLIAPQNTDMMVNRFQASITQSFPWFGTQKTKKKVAQLQAKSAYYNFLNQKNILFAQVAIWYYRLYGLQQKIHAHQKGLNLLESVRQVAHSQYINGAATLADVLSTDMRIAERQSKIEDLRAKRRPYRHQIETLVDTLLTVIDFPDSLLQKDRLWIPVNFEKQMRNQNQQLAALAWQAKAYRYQEKAAQKSGLPHFSIGVGYMNMEMGSKHTAGIVFPKIGISIPLNRKKYKAMEAKAQLLTKATLSQQKAVQNDLSVQLSVWQRKYQKAKRKIDLYTSLCQTARQTQQILLQSYSNGKTGFDEVLKMEQQALDYAVSKIQAQVSLKKYACQIKSLIPDNFVKNNNHEN